MNTYIYISYDLGGFSGDTDKEIENLVAQELKGERVGSGAGFKWRDLEFQIEKPLDEITLSAFAVKLRDKVGEDVAISQDAWVDGEDESVEEYSIEV